MRRTPRVLVTAAALSVLLAAPVSGAIFRPTDPFVTGPGAGPGGSDLSVLDADVHTIYGFGAAASTGYRVADDFVVPDTGGWDLDTIDFFAYQTGSTTTSTFTAVNLRIWDGMPDLTPDGDGAKVVYGDTTTNRLTSATFANVYRVTPTTTSNTSRPIMRLTVTADVTLPAGTYWADVQFAGSLASGPWAVPVTIPGQAVTGNARQFNAASWADMLDGTNVQGLAFEVHGSLDTVPGSPTVNPTTGAVTIPYSGTPASVVTAYECSLDGAAFSPCASGSTTLSDLASGGHTFAVRSRDAAGAVDSSPATFSIAVSKTTTTTPDTVAPVLVIASPSHQKVAKSVKATLVCAEDCTATLGGVVKAKPAKSVTLKAKTVSVKAGVPAKVTLTLSKKARKAINAALKADKKATVTLSGSAKDPAGNAGKTAKLKVTFAPASSARPLPTTGVVRVPAGLRIAGAAAERVAG